MIEPADVNDGNRSTRPKNKKKDADVIYIFGDILKTILILMYCREIEQQLQFLSEPI